MDLWLEVRSFNGVNKNQVCSISNTTTKELWMNRSVSTIGCSQLVSSTHSPKFQAILNQHVEAQMTYLVVETK